MRPEWAAGGWSSLLCAGAGTGRAPRTAARAAWRAGRRRGSRGARPGGPFACGAAGAGARASSGGRVGCCWCRSPLPWSARRRASGARGGGRARPWPPPRPPTCSTGIGREGGDTIGVFPVFGAGLRWWSSWDAPLQAWGADVARRARRHLVPLTLISFGLRLNHQRCQMSPLPSLHRSPYPP